MVSHLLLNMFLSGSRHSSCFKKFLMDIFAWQPQVKAYFYYWASPYCVFYEVSGWNSEFHFLAVKNWISKTKERAELPICWGLSLFTSQSSLPLNKHCFNVDENEEKWPVYIFFICLNVDCIWFLVHLNYRWLLVSGRGLSLSLQHLTSPLC